MAPLAEASLSRWFTPSFPTTSPEAVAAIRKILLANDPIGYAGCCAAIRDMDQRPTAMLNRTPTLVIAGSQDSATSVAEAEFLIESAEEARLTVLPAAHLSNMELAQRFSDIVVDFLQPPHLDNPAFE